MFCARVPAAAGTSCGHRPLATRSLWRPARRIRRGRDVDSSAAFTTPWVATLGARWQATDKVTLDAQVQRIGWSEFKTIDVNFAGGGSETQFQGYKDTTSGGVGLD